MYKAYRRNADIYKYVQCLTRSARGTRSTNRIRRAEARKQRSRSRSSSRRSSRETGFANEQARCRPSSIQTEVANHRDVTPRGHGLHEGLGAGLGDCAQIVDEHILRPGDAQILDIDRRIHLVGDNLAEEIGLRRNFV